MTPDAGRLIYRNMRSDDIERVIDLERASFPSIPDERLWRPGMLEAHITRFCEGQWVVEEGGSLVGSATNMRVTFAEATRQHTWREITGNGLLTTHRPEGDTLYGTEIMVHPDARRRGIAKHLYKMRKDFVRDNGLRAFVGGGRIPEYIKHADSMSPESYIARVVAGELTDRTLTAQLRSGMRVAGILKDYLADSNSLNYATILIWEPSDP